MMKKEILSIVLSVLSFAAVHAQGVKAWEGTLELPTYLLDPAEEAPVFDSL